MSYGWVIVVNEQLSAFSYFEFQTYFPQLVSSIRHYIRWAWRSAQVILTYYVLYCDAQSLQYCVHGETIYFVISDS